MRGEVVVVDDVPGEFAERFIDAFHARASEQFSVALSGGDTARRCYERLADDGEQVDWWAVDVYWGDERCVPRDSPDSNERLVRESLLERVGAAGNVHPMRCSEGADAYQLKVGELGRFDLIHLGIGPDGHTASLFPGSAALDSGAGRLVVMNTDPSGLNPHERMTLTMKAINRARLVVVTAEGEAKADALGRIAAGDPLPPCDLDPDHLVWLLDPAAASKIESAA
jgi:6-phosphogluconolactonase